MNYVYHHLNVFNLNIIWFCFLFNLAGPFTVFVPSNEALQKVPDSDLDIIRNNMTALKG